MTSSEHQVMLLELLRVVAGILTDVAQAYANAVEGRRRARDGEEDEFAE